MKVIRLWNPVDREATSVLVVGPVTVRCHIRRHLTQWSLGVDDRHVWNMSWWRR